MAIEGFYFLSFNIPVLENINELKLSLNVVNFKFPLIYIKVKDYNLFKFGQNQITIIWSLTKIQVSISYLVSTN